MALQDTWFKHERGPDGKRTGRRVPTAKHGQGLRYRVRYGQHDRSFDSKGAAQRFEYRIRSEAPKTTTADIVVGDLVERWLAGKQGLSKSRIDGCNAAAARVLERWRHVPARDVTEQDVREWQASLRVGGSSIRKAMECLSGSMRLAVKMGAADANPCTDVRRPAEPVRDARYLTPAELELLAEHAGEYRPMVLLMGTTGIRIGEACNLRVGDVDRKRRRLWVASRTAKSRKGREVGIPPSVLALLPLTGRKRTDYVFTSSKGERVDEHNWRNRHFARMVEQSGLGDLTPHDLRHTAVSLAIRSGADIKVVQRVAGHSSVKLTGDRYGHLWDEGLDDVAARMEGLLGGTEDGR